jgi:hypothetical protein
MKYVFIALLILNFLAEAMAALSLIGGPDGIAAAGSGGQWSMHYGFAVIAIASAGLWVWPLRRETAALTAVLGILTVFHISVLISLALAGDQPVGVAIHSVLGALSVLCLLQRRAISQAWA